MNPDIYRTALAPAAIPCENSSPGASPRIPTSSVINLAATPCRLSDLSNDSRPEPSEGVSLEIFMATAQKLSRNEARNLLSQLINQCTLMQQSGEAHLTISAATVLCDKGKITLATLNSVMGQDLYYQAIADFYSAIVNAVKQAQNAQQRIGPVMEASNPVRNHFYHVIQQKLAMAKASASEYFQPSSIGFYSKLNQQLCQPLAAELALVRQQIQDQKSPFDDVWEALLYQGIADAWAEKAKFALSSSPQQDWINLGKICAQVLACLAEPVDFVTPGSERQCRELLNLLQKPARPARI